jgi:acyl-CoA synthetase (AMP-forming)/AMP-acid ligase II
LTTVAARLASLFITYANEMFVTPADAMLHVASLAHGSGTKVLPVFAQGREERAVAKFSPLEFFRLVEAHKVTISWMVPTMVAMLDRRAGARALRSVEPRSVIYGGAPMPEPVLERALAAFGPIFVQIYGLTEAPHPDLILARHEHCPDPLAGRRLRAGARARARSASQVRLVDADGRDVVPGRDRRDHRRGPARDGRLLERSRSDRRGSARRLVLHRGPCARRLRAVCTRSSTAARS